MLKVLHISFAKYGGAGIAAFRLHNDINNNRELGIQSNWLDINTFFNYQNSSLFKRFLKRLISIIRSGNNSNVFKNKNLDVEVLSDLEGVLDKVIGEYDIIHLHWIDGLLDYRTFFKKVKHPIVWTCHDMNPFMGIVHYELDLLRNKNHDSFIAKNEEVFNCKLRLYKNANITFVTTSNDFKKRIHDVIPDKSVFLIPYGFNLQIFKSRNKNLCREVLDLPTTKRLTIGFSSLDLLNYRKGLDLLLEACISLKISIELVLVGGGNLEEHDLIMELRRKGQNVHLLGVLNDQRMLSVFYNSIDCLIMPSREEAFGQVLGEALLCGTPVISFKSSGALDLINTGNNGILINNMTSGDLANAIETFEKSKASFCSAAVRETVIEYLDSRLVTEKYRNLYHSLYKDSLKKT